MKKTAPRSTVSTRKPVPSAKPPARARRPAAAPRAAAAPRPAVVRPQDGVEAGLQALRGEIESLRQAVASLAAPAAESSAGLEQAAMALRRILSDMVEREMEPVAAAVARVRGEVAAGAPAARITERLDAVMDELGAIRYDARPLDAFDPLIHVAAGEGRRADFPDGVVVESLRPGYRTARGSVLAKAAVVVNRRA